MPRACTKCGRLVAEAAYCPFCSEPTIEHVPVPVHRSEGSEVRTILTVSTEKNPWVEYIVIISIPMAFAGASLAMIFVPCIGIACFVLFGAVFFLMIHCAGSSTLHCPRCEKNLAHLTGQNVRYCPFCGADLAVEIYPKSDELTEFFNKISGQPGVEIKSTDIQIPPGKPTANTDIQIPPGKVEKETAK